MRRVLCVGAVVLVALSACGDGEEPRSEKRKRQSPSATTSELDRTRVDSDAREMACSVIAGVAERWAAHDVGAAYTAYDKLERDLVVQIGQRGVGDPELREEFDKIVTGGAPSEFTFQAFLDWCTTNEVAFAAPPTTTTVPPPPPPPPLTYELNGSGSALVTYGVGPGFNQQQENVTLPWSSSPTPPQFPSLVAQLQGSGEINCRILRNGVEVANATSSGQYVVVTCAPR